MQQCQQSRSHCVRGREDRDGCAVVVPRAAEGRKGGAEDELEQQGGVEEGARGVVGEL